MRVAGLGPKKRNTITKALQETVEKSLDMAEERGHQLIVDSKRHIVELARRPHIGEGARCVIKAVERKSPKQRYILS